MSYLGVTSSNYNPWMPPVFSSFQLCGWLSNETWKISSEDTHLVISEMVKCRYLMYIRSHVFWINSLYPSSRIKIQGSFETWQHRSLTCRYNKSHFWIPDALLRTSALHIPSRDAVNTVKEVDGHSVKTEARGTTAQNKCYPITRSRKGASAHWSCR